MKKAGIILGIVFIVAAILLYVIASKVIEHKENKEDVNNQNSVVNQVNVSENNQNMENVNNQQINDSNIGSQGETNQIVDNSNNLPIQQQEPQVIVQEVEISGVTTISEEALTKTTLVETKDVIALLSNKRILLIDEDTKGTGSKMLTYCFDVLPAGESRSLVLFVTGSVYEQYNVGDNLRVSYKVYRNDVGVDFPIVLSVLSVNND